MATNTTDRHDTTKTSKEIGEKLNQIPTIADPIEKFSSLMATTILINHFINVNAIGASILSNLNKWIKKIHSILASIASTANAISYSITVGTTGLSISVTWKV